MPSSYLDYFVQNRVVLEKPSLSQSNGKQFFECTNFSLVIFIGLKHLEGVLVGVGVCILKYVIPLQEIIVGIGENQHFISVHQGRLAGER